MKRNLLLFIIILLITSFYGCDKCSEKNFSPQQREPFSLLPQDDIIVGELNIAKIIKLQKVKEILDTLKINEKFLGKNCNFDLFSKVDRVEVGFNSYAYMNGTFGSVISGNFDEETILNCVRKRLEVDGKRLEETVYKNFHVYGIGGINTAFSFLDNNNFVAGDRMTVKKILDIASGDEKQNVRSNQKLLAIYNKLGDNKDIVLVSILDEYLRNRLMSGYKHLSDDQGPVADLETLGIGIAVEPQVSLLINLDYSKSESGESLKKTLEKQISDHQDDLVLMRLNGFIEPISFTLTNKTLTIRGNWATANFESLLKRSFIMYEENQKLIQEKNKLLLNGGVPSNQNPDPDGGIVNNNNQDNNQPVKN